MGIRLEVENKTGIRNAEAKAVALPFKEIEESTGVLGFKFSDIDAVHVGDNCNAIIEHTMTASLKEWKRDDWYKKCFKYFKMFEGTARPTYIICTTNKVDHTDTKVIPLEDIKVCFVFEVTQNGVEEVRKKFRTPDTLVPILQDLFRKDS